MKTTKKLLRTSLALMLVFFSLCGALTVHAGQIKAPDAFSSIKVNGTELDLSKCPEEYTLSSYTKGTATVEWELQEGWVLSSAVYAATEGEVLDYKYKEIKSGATLKIPTKGSAEVVITALDPNNEENYAFYNIHFYSGKPSLTGGTLWVGSGENYFDSDNIKNLSYTTPVTSFTSSNPSVLQAKKGSSLWACTVTPKKAGKSTLTLVVKVNGETQTFKATCTVKKYSAPLKILKVAGKSVNLKKNKFTITKQVSKSKVKVEFKLNKGWKLVQCRYYDFDKSKYVKVKSGGSVSVPKDFISDLEITMKKGSDKFTYYLVLKR